MCFDVGLGVGGEWWWLFRWLTPWSRGIVSGWRCALLFRVYGLVLWFMGDSVALWGLWWRFIGCCVGKSIVFRFSVVLAEIDVDYLGLVDLTVCRWLAGGHLW